MPPAASDDLFQQQSRSVGDPSPPLEDLNSTPPENDQGGKKKKGKSGSKGKTKAAKAAAKSPPEDLIQASPPLHAEPSSCPNPTLVSHRPNAVTSPVLDALGCLGDSPENDLAYRTDNWAKAIPFGKSPPNDVSDGEIANGSPFGFPSNPDKAGFSHPSSTSPPPRARPLSYGNGYLGSDLSRQQSVDRHNKSYSVSGPFSNPIPLPHKPQAHFYGAPEIDLPLLAGQTKQSVNENYSFCAFDTIYSPSAKSSRMGTSVLVVGMDGSLEVLAVEDRKTRLVGKLAGLNGRVIDAKILACNSPSDSFAPSRPHVAIVMHGPCGLPDDETRSSSVGSDVNEIPAASIGRSPGERRSAKDDTRFYQTRVEIYSLRTGDHISTLFTMKPSPYFENIPGLSAVAPSPAGNLKLLAGGNYVVLASGASGEVFIYSMNGYQCLGKIWTSIRSREARRYSTSSSSTDPDGSRTDSPPGFANSDTPIVALRGRWLAIVPPSSTYRVSLPGTVPSSLIQGKVFGLDSRNPPARPAITCATDVGEGPSFFDKVARGVTQELVRGARWMGDQGLQAWNNYWNKDQLQNSTPRRSLNSGDLPPPGYNAFPPTHAQDTNATTPAEPDLVSIMDLKRLEDGSETKSALFNPVATFQPPEGCSFLSFSPNGLMMLTASTNGDVQHVWDLMQAKYCRAGTFLSEDLVAPCANVRQIARYTRLTKSYIVDVIWCPPSGDRLAVITRKGTVHVFDLPRSAFQWPPFRRARPAPSKTPAIEPPTDELSDKAAPVNPLSAAFKLVGGKTQPILAAVRGRTASAGGAFPAVGGFSSSAGVRGGKAVAAGLSKSMGAATGTVNTLRHAGENRLHGLARDPAASRVTWITSKGQPFLGLVESGHFRLYRVRRAMSTHKNRQLQSVVGGKEIEFRLPPNLHTPCGPLPVTTFNPETTVHASLALPSSNPRPSPASKLKCQPLSQAEIETNAPYQPFHTDQRVSLYVYPETGSVDDSMTIPTGQWVFGESLPMTRIHVRPFSAGGDDDETLHEHQLGSGGEMENLISLGNSTGHPEEVVITTRRKKRHASSFPSTGSGGDDGFFEDDCDFLDFARDRV
ncbi:hypothetical protein ETB97_003652 [Aspergillus alliaceus]|uniref:WD40-repeat-containing domain protein n=1 Tax=Petromyces alliaceus TaxID=209559 RepID=A0A5N7C1I8_PETAA|nr:hypothetical protein BDV23DRAFT_160627 [Aspergillus alliaceus]KAF5858855.1 hypothetical protein ETB97_003652 [Aspergillus burnettii]